jgi:hypothetical protein
MRGMIVSDSLDRRGDFEKERAAIDSHLKIKFKCQ